MGSIEFSILWPALLAAYSSSQHTFRSAGKSCRAEIVFIDLAIAQVAGLGVTASDALGFAASGWRVQAAAAAAALIGAVLLTWTEKLWPEVQEALIGVLSSCLPPASSF